MVMSTFAWNCPDDPLGKVRRPGTGQTQHSCRDLCGYPAQGTSCRDLCGYPAQGTPTEIYVGTLPKALLQRSMWVPCPRHFLQRSMWVPCPRHSYRDLCGYPAQGTPTEIYVGTLPKALPAEIYVGTLPKALLQRSMWVPCPRHSYRDLCGYPAHGTCSRQAAVSGPSQKHSFLHTPKQGTWSDPKLSKYNQLWSTFNL